MMDEAIREDWGLQVYHWDTPISIKHVSGEESWRKKHALRWERTVDSSFILEDLSIWK